MRQPDPPNEYEARVRALMERRQAELATMDESPCHPSCCHACEVCSNAGCEYNEWERARTAAGR